MNVADLFRRHAGARPLAVAFSCGSETLTWADVDRRSDALASVFVAHLDAGDRVGIVGRNCHRYWEVFAACAKAGVVCVPLNHRLLPDEMAGILADVGARGIVVDGTLDLERLDGSVLTDSFAGGVAVAWGTGDKPEVASYEDVVGRAVDERPDRIHEINAIGYTSGTTGRPRGAILDQHTATMSALWFATLFSLTSESTFLACMPAYVYRSQAGGMAPVVVGARIVPQYFDAGRVLRTIDEQQVTHVILAPAMVDRLLAHPELTNCDLSSLQSTWIGGAPSSPAAVVRLAEHIGGTIGSVYGMTEATGIASTRWNLDAAGDDLDREVRSVGRPSPLVDIRLVGSDGAAVGDGEPGEIVVRGDTVMRGYWGEPPGQALTDGWYHTGDIATRDPDGRLFLVDRRADIIVSGGLNVYAAEVERVVATHPAVRASAVVSRPDDRWGETVAAVIALTDGATITLDELQQHCAGSLASYKRPRHLLIVDELPANAMGKIDKRSLRARFWDGHERSIG